MENEKVSYRETFAPTNIVCVKFSLDADRAIYHFLDGSRLYWDDALLPVLKSPEGLVRHVEANNEYFKAANNYNGQCGDEHTMSGPDMAEWRRERAKA